MIRSRSIYGPISAQAYTQLPARLVALSKSGGVVTDNSFPSACNTVDNSLMNETQFGFIATQFARVSPLA